MPTDYPLPIRPPFGPFPPFSLLAKPLVARQVGKALVTVGGEDYRPVTLKAPSSPLAGVTRLALVHGERTSRWYHDGRESQDKLKYSGPIEPFWLCPGADDAAVRLGWKLRNEDAIEKLVLEVTCPGLLGPVALKEVSGAALTADPVPAEKLTGSLAVGALLDPGTGAHADKFPGGKLTVEYSPYRVRATVHLKQGSTRKLYPSSAWTFFHVLVDHIELDWGEEGMIPAEPPAGVHASLEQEARDLELELFQQLRARAVTDGHALELRSPLFSGRAGPALPETNNEAFKLAWGDGPRIPLVARALLRKADGSAATFDESKDALGRTSFLWDWHDDPDRRQGWVVPGDFGHSDISRQYMERLLAHREPGREPPGSINVPLGHGGKRGDLARPVFPAMSEGSSLGYEVGPSADRPWASVSHAGTGTKAGMTAVLFQPAPFAGDQYHVSVTLAPGKLLGDRPRLDDFAGTLASLRGSRLPVATSGAFDVLRKIKVRFVTVAPVAPDLIAKLHEAYRALSIVVDLEQVELPRDWVSRRWDQLRNRVTGDAEYHSISEVLGIPRDQPPQLVDRLIRTLSYEQFQQAVRDALARNNTYTFLCKAQGDVGERLALAGGAHGFVMSCLRAETPQGEEGTFYRWVLLMEEPGQTLPPDATFGNARHPVRELRQVLCAGHTIGQRDAMPGQPRHEVWVEFPAVPGDDGIVKAHYKRVGLGKRRRSVPSAAREALRAVLERLARPGAQDHGQQLVVRIHVNDPHDEDDRERFRRMKDEVLTQFHATYAVLNVEPLLGALFASVDVLKYHNRLTNNLKSICVEFAKVLADEDPAFRGVLILVTPSLGFEDKVYGGVLFNHDSEAVKPAGYIALGEGIPPRQSFFTPGQLLIHEVGHALFHPGHAQRGLWLMGANERPVADHLPYDRCIMSYDAEPTTADFCGQCMLDMRGWRLPAAPQDLGAAIEAHSRERDGTADARAKAWKTLRLAYLTDLANDRARTRALLDEARAAWDDNVVPHDSREGITMLRVIIYGYETKVQDARAARELNDELRALTRHPSDLAIIGGLNPLATSPRIEAVELLEGDAAVVGVVTTQFVNLPRRAPFDAGRVTASLDRLGREVRVRVRFPEAGRHRFRLQLVGHQSNVDYTATERQTAAFNYEPTEHRLWLADGAFTRAYQPAVEGVTGGDGVGLATVVLPPAAGRYVVVALDDNGIAVQTQELRAERVVFYQRVLCEGRPREDAAGEDQVQELLDQAFRPGGVRVIGLGDEELFGHRIADNREGKYQPLFADAAELAARHGRLRPYLMQFVLAEACVGEVGFMRWGGAVDLGAAPPEVELRRGQITAGAELPIGAWRGVLYKSDYLQDDVFAAVFPNADPEMRAHYRGSGTDKPWFLWGEFRAAGHPARELELDDVEPVEEDPARFTGRFNRIRLTLSAVRRWIETLPEPRPTGGEVSIAVLLVSYPGGFALKSPWQTAITTRPAYGNDPDSAERQARKMIHELGHLLGMVATPPTTGLDAPETRYERDGSHCAEGMAEDLEEHQYLANRDQAACVMFEAVANVGSFCAENCLPVLKKLDAGDGFCEESRVWRATPH